MSAKMAANRIRTYVRTKAIASYYKAIARDSNAININFSIKVVVFNRVMERKIENIKKNITRKLQDLFGVSR